MSKKEQFSVAQNAVPVQMSPISMSFAISDDYSQYLAVALTSILVNNPSSFFVFHILHRNISTVSQSRIREVESLHPHCRLVFHQVDSSRFENFPIPPELEHVTQEMYYRYLLPEILQDEERTIYSDVDVIFREDLSKYYAIDLKDNYFAGVDSLPAINADDLLYAQKTLGEKIKNGYFYSGNLILNLKLLRQDNKIEEFRGLGDCHFKFQDMDIINLTCSGRVLPLGPSFCLSTYYYDSIMSGRESVKAAFGKDELDHALKSGIVHYNGAKPWKEVCPNMDIWWSYYRRSIFYDEEFTHKFWKDQTYRLEKMSLMKRIKLVGRYFRKGGRM